MLVKRITIIISCTRSECTHHCPARWTLHECSTNRIVVFAVNK